MLPACVLAISAALSLGSSSRCPATDQIEPRVEALLAQGQRTPDGGAGDAFDVTREGQALTITRVASDGRVVEQRTLALHDASCAGAAEDAAVVIAAMLTEFRPAWIATLPPAAPVAPPRRFGLRAVALALAPAQAIGADARSWRLSAEVDVGRARGTWLGTGGAFFELGERLDVAGGRAVVTRGGLALGGGAQVWRGAWGLTARGEVGAALTSVRGEGFSPNGVSHSADAVALAGLEGARRWGPWALAAGPFVESWPRPQGLRVTNVSSSPDVPATEVLLRVSVGYRPPRP